jgi:hypothetical protein
MPACPRRDIIAANEVGIYHCYNRCVRRAFLCGCDPISGQNFDHRKEWIQLRLELLAVSFGIEICDFALLDNHIHLILRTRPEIVAAWQDREVALRWWRICPERRNEKGEAAEPLACELNQWLDDPEQMVELRERLSSISWFMRLLCQKVARMANDEDGVRGKFWNFPPYCAPFPRSHKHQFWLRPSDWDGLTIFSCTVCEGAPALHGVAGCRPGHVCQAAGAVRALLCQPTKSILRQMGVDWLEPNHV